jgi:predicted Fe-S protein YdhL (DUF1289 family)
MGMICELCLKTITESTPWSILDGKRQHIIKSDCKIKAKKKPHNKNKKEGI